MYGVVRTRQFERAFAMLRRSGKMPSHVAEEIDEVILALASKRRLDPIYRDHALAGEYGGYRECHIRGDLLLMYEIQDEKLILVLLDIGSHSQLFG